MGPMATIDWLDRMSLGWLLLLNGVLAAFTILANGGWLLLATSGKVPAADVAAAGSAPYVLVLIASLVLVSSLVGWFWPTARTGVLKAQTLGVGSLAAYVVLIASEVVVGGGSLGTKFVWDPVLFAFLVAYAVYLARRTLVPAPALRRPVIRYAHIYAALIALAVGVLVLWRVSAP